MSEAQSSVVKGLAALPQQESSALKEEEHGFHSTDTTSTEDREADLSKTTTAKAEMPATTETEPATAAATATTAETETVETTEEADPRSKNPFWKPRPPPIMGPDGKPLSRNAMKKLLKQQQFEERKPQLRAQEKLKRKQKSKERHDAIEAVKSMVDQIKRCYSYNRTCEKIVHLALTSFTGQSKQEFCKRANGFELWKNFTIHEKGLEEVWPSEEISGKQHLAELKRLQAIASAKSEAVKAKVLATYAQTESASSSASTLAPLPIATGAEEGGVNEKNSSEALLSSASTTESGLGALSEVAIQNAVEKQDNISAKEAEASPFVDQTYTSPLSTPGTPATLENGTTTNPALDIKALEKERQQKEEKLATIPAVKKVVYLSADSPNTITQLEENTCYVLGGIVDKNRYPNLCQNKAEKLGIETAQLPIGDYIQMSSRRILTVNQVFEILLQFIECNDWKEAFLKVIPQRKLEEKPRVRRSVESWRPNHHARDEQLSGFDSRESRSGSEARSITSSHESEDEGGWGREGEVQDQPMDTDEFKKRSDSV